jgi:hypothetical protein
VLCDCSSWNRITPDTDLSRRQVRFGGARALVSASDSKGEIGDYLVRCARQQIPCGHTRRYQGR